MRISHNGFLGGKMNIQLGFTIFMILGILIIGVTAFIFIRLIRQYTGFLRDSGKLKAREPE